MIRYECRISTVVIWSLLTSIHKIIRFFSSIFLIFKSKLGIGFRQVLICSLIISESFLTSSTPIISSLSFIPQINAPPEPFANALMLLHQLFGFFFFIVFSCFTNQVFYILNIHKVILSNKLSYPNYIIYCNKK